ncbi:reverse transcriptase domain-containing protein [Tanacetum coccineum]
MAEEDEEKRLSTPTKESSATQKCRPASRTLKQLTSGSWIRHLKKQIDRNLEVYVDDLVIKSHTEGEILRDIEETFHNLRRINMKLNPKKCTFGAEEGAFLGHVVSMKGIKACPEKVEAVMKLQSPQTLKERLPMDTRSGKSVPKHEEMYSGTAYGNRTKIQRRADNVPMRNQRGDKRSSFNRKGLAANTNLFRHPCSVSPRDKLQSDRKSGFSISARHKKAEKAKDVNHGQILADFIVEKPDEEGPSAEVPRSENKKADALSKIASTNFAHLTKQVLVETLKRKSIEKREILAVLEEEGYCWMTPLIEYLTEGTLPAETKKARTIKIKARQYTMINGVLYKKSFLEPWLRSVVAKVIRSGYYWPTMHKDARNIIRTCNDCQTHRPVPRNPQQKLTPITSPWPFYKWGIDISGPFLEGQGKVKFFILAIDYFTKWIEAKPVATVTGNQVKKFVWDNIICRFGLPREIISDNGKQFRDNPFKD